MQILGNIGFVLLIIWVIIFFMSQKRRVEPTDKEIKKEQEDKLEKERLWKENNKDIIWGNIFSEIICLHCQTKGHVRVKQVINKKGVSGGKATAALLTGGISLLATGLSRKENESQLHCDNCGMTWVV
jgi:hypothetical protein